MPMQRTGGDSVSPLLSSLLLDGIVGGVGAVVGFYRLLWYCFPAGAFEDCGYTARIAVVMDRYLKSWAFRKIYHSYDYRHQMRNTRHYGHKNHTRRASTPIYSYVNTFMPCGAKLPVIALFAGVFFKDAAWVGTSMYFVGIAIIIVGALIVNKITGEGPPKECLFYSGTPGIPFPA